MGMRMCAHTHAYACGVPLVVVCPVVVHLRTRLGSYTDSVGIKLAILDLSVRACAGLCSPMHMCELRLVWVFPGEQPMPQYSTPHASRRVHGRCHSDP